ncbi:hypothetical protein [Glaesserella parasuis]|uniref:hypothetical protein n=1 Tax=Glaesserella parasuis TaxID=738 RepID=UPI0024363004|nr:hypothetical protein [Glaesserella parasuis]
MVGQDPTLQVGGISKIPAPHCIVKKKKKKNNSLHKTKNKITRIFQLLLSIIKKLEIIGGNLMKAVI